VFELRAPIGVNFKITNRCNLRCDHCLASCGDVGKDELSLKEILAIIDDLKENDVFFIDITGGEPLMHKDIFTILKYINKKNMSLSLATNATLVNDYVIENLKRIDLKVVKVSLDGSNAAIHEMQRKGMSGCFDQTCAGIKRLKAENFPVTAVVTISKRNFLDIENIIHLAIDLKVDAINLFPVVPGGRGAALENFILSPDELETVFKMLIRFEEVYGTKIKFIHESPLYNVSKIQEKKCDMCDEYSACMAGSVLLFIMENGSVVPCPFFTEPIGNLNKMKLKDIWKQDSYMKDIIKEDFLDEKCRKCEYLKACFGGCRAASKNMYGTISRKDPFCWVGNKI
jgi:AdoMet-dependent heme synthase